MNMKQKAGLWLATVLFNIGAIDAKESLKISVDGVEVFELSPTQQKVLNYVEKLTDKKLKKEIKNQIISELNRSFDTIKRDWVPQLKSDGIEIPTNKDDFLELIFSTPNFTSNYGNECGEVKGVVQISLNGTPLLELSKNQKQLLCNSAQEPFTEAVIAQKIAQVLTKWTHGANQRFRFEWEPKLTNKGLDYIPFEDEAFAELAFSQSDFPTKLAKARKK